MKRYICLFILIAPALGTSSLRIASIEEDRDWVKTTVKIRLSDDSNWLFNGELSDLSAWEKGSEVELLIQPNGYLTSSRVLRIKNTQSDIEVRKGQGLSKTK